MGPRLESVDKDRNRLICKVVRMKTMRRRIIPITEAERRAPGAVDWSGLRSMLIDNQQVSPYFPMSLYMEGRYLHKGGGKSL